MSLKKFNKSAGEFISGTDNKLQSFGNSLTGNNAIGAANGAGICYGCSDDNLLHADMNGSNKVDFNSTFSTRLASKIGRNYLCSSKDLIPSITPRYSDFCYTGGFLLQLLTRRRKLLKNIFVIPRLMRYPLI